MALEASFLVAVVLAILEGVVAAFPWDPDRVASAFRALVDPFQVLRAAVDFAVAFQDPFDLQQIIFFKSTKNSRSFCTIISMFNSTFLFDKAHSNISMKNTRYNCLIVLYKMLKLQICTYTHRHTRALKHSTLPLLGNQ